MVAPPNNGSLLCNKNEDGPASETLLSERSQAQTDPSTSRLTPESSCEPRKRASLGGLALAIHGCLYMPMLPKKLKVDCRTADKHSIVQDSQVSCRAQSSSLKLPTAPQLLLPGVGKRAVG
jgi:hypothetical protein